MLKKTIIAILALVLFSMGYVYVNKLYYPPLPIKSLHKKELVTKGHEAVNQLVYATTENGYDWYIVSQESSITAGELIQQASVEQDWHFVEQLGSGYIFEKNNEQLIMTTKMWSRNFQLVQVPANRLQLK